MKFGKRVLLFLHWLASVIGMASIVFQKQTEWIIQSLQAKIGADYAHIAFIALMALYAFMSIVCLILIVKRDAKRGVGQHARAPLLAVPRDKEQHEAQNDERGQDAPDDGRDFRKLGEHRF